METAATTISDLIDELPSPSSLEMPKFGKEPEAKELAEELDFDLSELDDLLAESMKAAKKKYITPRDLIRQVAACNVPVIPPHEVTENLAVWEQHTCICGMIAPAIFLHYKEKQVSRATVIWKQVEVIDSTKPLRHALRTRNTQMCEDCCDVDSAQMEDISHAF